jgi:hypothetical protein
VLRSSSPLDAPSAVVLAAETGVIPLAPRVGAAAYAVSGSSAGSSPAGSSLR